MALFAMVPKMTAIRKIGVNHGGTIVSRAAWGSVMSRAVPASAPSPVNSTLGTKAPSAVHAATATGDVVRGR